MPDKAKRLDLRFGSFACSIQGFDDPVQPVQQVLQALQNMLEETPALGESGIAFDAGAIEQLIGEVARRADVEEANVEIVPGLIIVHRSGVSDGYPETYDEGADGGLGGNEAWSQPFVAGTGDAGGDAGGDTPAGPESTDTEADAGNGYVNIFTPAAHAGSEGVSGGATDDEAEPEGDPVSARLAEIYQAEAGSGEGGDPQDEPARSSFADTGDDPGGEVFANPLEANTGEDSADDEPLSNLFSPTDSPEGDPGAAEAGDGDEPGAPGNAFTVVGSNGSGEGSAEQGVESARGEALFGKSEDQPEIEEADEGYTAAGLAQTAGAETVTELMVSAAAWMVLIQGQTSFTRREVVNVFTSIPGEHDTSLEARIKGFGKAVRNDQLIMVEDGVFGLSRTELERFQRLL